MREEESPLGTVPAQKYLTIIFVDYEYLEPTYR